MDNGDVRKWIRFFFHLFFLNHRFFFLSHTHTHENGKEKVHTHTHVQTILDTHTQLWEGIQMTRNATL